MVQAQRGHAGPDFIAVLDQTDRIRQKRMPGFMHQLVHRRKDLVKLEHTSLLNAEEAVYLAVRAITVKLRR